MGTGTTDGQQGATPCLSSLGYEVECITPVDEEPASLATGQDPIWKSAAADEDDMSGLDVLSRVASSQLHETSCPRRRFSILDLPLSQFMIDSAVTVNGDDGGGRTVSSSPDAISAGYNVPSAGDCATVTSETLTRVIQQQNSTAEATAEQRPGDVFTALKVDVGQYCTEPVFENTYFMYFTLFRNDISKSRKKSQKVSSLLNVCRNLGPKTPGCYGYLYVFITHRSQLFSCVHTSEQDVCTLMLVTVT